MRRPRAGVLAFAHRGGAYHPEIEGLENTMAAFRHAVDLGYGYLETDVHVTRDGVLLAFHDQVLDRVSDRRGAIARAHPRRGRRGAGRRPGAGADAAPSCSTRSREARFNIDLKSDGAVAAAGRLRRASAAPGTGCWSGSFSPRRLRAFRRLAGRPGRHLGAPAGGRGVPAAAQRPARRPADPRPGRGAAGPAPARALGAGRPPGLVRRAHAAGKHVHVWTIDDPAEMRELLDRGVDGLITDRTDILRDVLVERGEWTDWREES